MQAVLPCGVSTRHTHDRRVAAYTADWLGTAGVQRPYSDSESRQLHAVIASLQSHVACALQGDYLLKFFCFPCALPAASYCF